MSQNQQEKKELTVGQRLLSDMIVFSKYARYRPDKGRRETVDELFDRYETMMVNRYPGLKKAIKKQMVPVREGKAVPSMRALQFAGPAIETNNNRIYNCFGRETSFVTSAGVKSFLDFQDGDEIVVPTHKGRWKKAVVRNYGPQQLYHLPIKRGRSTYEIRVTMNHRWILKDGRETITLQKGDKIMSSPDIFGQFRYVDSNPIERLYWAYGYVFGDGTKVKDSSGSYKYSMVRLCGKDKGLYLDRFIELGFKHSTSASLGDDVIVYTGGYTKEAPDPKKDDPSLIRAFVAGYLDADGGRNNFPTQISLFNRIVAKGKEHQEVVEKLFPIAGVYVSSERDLTGKETNFGVRGDTKDYNLSTNLDSKSPSVSFIAQEMIEDEIEDVWCLEVEEDRSFILANGIVTGNCAYMPIDALEGFSELMYLLLGGTGVGYSVQKRHISKLPKIIPSPDRKMLTQFSVPDSIEGWAEAIFKLLEGWTNPSKPFYIFDYDLIRPQGAEIHTAGGFAPGPGPLRETMNKMSRILAGAQGRQLTSLEVFDICNHISMAVYSGGIRRAASICLFDRDDRQMLYSKAGRWYDQEPQRAMANISAVLPRDQVRASEFRNLFEITKASGAGEPGFFWTNDPELGVNPCAEISLRPFSFCNLSEVDVGACTSEADFMTAVGAAAFFGTLQAGFTDLKNLRPIWRTTTEEDSLVGVSLTGIATYKDFPFDLTKGASWAIEVNKETAETIGIKPAKRVTTIKPSGTASLYFGTSSGIHPYYAPYYYRRVRLNKDEVLSKVMERVNQHTMEEDSFKPENWVVSIPVKSPDTGITRDEPVLDMLTRIRRFYHEWVKPGHIEGGNTNNISATVSVRPKEWDEVKQWLWENRDCYQGITVLPYDGGSYKQAPFEEISQDEYEVESKYLTPIDFHLINETIDHTNPSGEIACGGGSCEVSYL